MASDQTIHTPTVKWAQRSDKVFLTIDLPDTKDPKIDLKEDSLSLKCIGGTEQVSHEVDIQFYDKLDTEKSKYVIRPRNIEMVLFKKEDGPFWPRLFKEKMKTHWLKTDFERWQDEDDSNGEEDDKKDVPLEQMMSQMGGFNTSPGGLGDNVEEDEDSDDEELPDLE